MGLDGDSFLDRRKHIWKELRYHATGRFKATGCRRQEEQHERPWEEDLLWMRLFPLNPRSSGELCTPWPHLSMLLCPGTEHGTPTTIPRTKPAGSGVVLSELYPMMPVGGG